MGGAWIGYTCSCALLIILQRGAWERENMIAGVQALLALGRRSLHSKCLGLDPLPLFLDKQGGSLKIAHAGAARMDSKRSN
jgi:hypothetical protein